MAWRAAFALALLAQPLPGSEPIRVTALTQETADGPQRIFVARVDLRDPRVELRVSGPVDARPDDPEGTEARLLSVPEWAEHAGATLAINANFFARLAGAPARWTAGQPVALVGPSVSEGRVVSHASRYGLGHPALLLTRKRDARIKCALERDLRGQDDVVAGASDAATRGCLLVEKGRNHGERRPRRCARAIRERPPGWRATGAS